MSLFSELKDMRALTAREVDIRDYILAHPEEVVSMSCRELGKATYSSASSVSRFCKKLGYDSYPSFKLHFSSELAAGHTTDLTNLQLSEQENLVSVFDKVTELEQQALASTRAALSMPKLLRLQRLLNEHSIIDFYAYDMNVLLARYACSLYIHAGKSATTYTESNEQVLHALTCPSTHLAVIISHTGESKRLIELARLLGQRHVKRIIITASRSTSLGALADEYLYAATVYGMHRMWECAFATGVKYLIDLMFAIMFSADFERNMELNNEYEQLGNATYWNLTREFWTPMD